VVRVSSTTLRVSTDTRDRVNALRGETGESTDELLVHALEAYERERFWRDMQSTHEHLSETRRTSYEVEKRSWEGTGKDGLVRVGDGSHVSG